MKKNRAEDAPEIADGRFPDLDLPIKPPFPPMEAKRVETIPSGEDWQYEPKWDGFRALIFRDGEEIAIQSKAGQPLTRYFPEIVEALRGLRSKRFVLDGEIVVPVDGILSFDDLLQRIHPAESRVRKLAATTPAHLFVFDLLVTQEKRTATSLVANPLTARRAALEDFFASVDHPLLALSPATIELATARSWFSNLGALGLDGVMAKKMSEPYHSGDRDGMVKVKHLKSAECVVGGFRYATGSKMIGSLLLGLYDDEGHLVFIGHTSSFSRTERETLRAIVEPLRSENPFSVRVPGGPSRWASERTGEWEPLKPKLVCEVEYDYFSQMRFRHGSKFLRWRPEKKPKDCTMDQVMPKRKAARSKGPVIFENL
jgi:ATP-dependent DNA ligase